MRFLNEITLHSCALVPKILQTKMFPIQVVQHKILQLYQLTSVNFVCVVINVVRFKLAKLYILISAMELRYF